jgi:hypothetical protein
MLNKKKLNYFQLSLKLKGKELQVRKSVNSVLSTVDKTKIPHNTRKEQTFYPRWIKSVFLTTPKKKSVRQIDGQNSAEKLAKRRFFI